METHRYARRSLDSYDLISNEQKKERFSCSTNNAFTLLLTIVLFFTGQFSVRATHVVGGGVTYTHISGTEYLLQLKLYRDCSPGTYPLPPSVDMELRYDDGVLPTPSSVNMPLVSNEELNPSIPACVFDPGICVEEAIYETIVDMPEGVGGFHMYFTLCCRNATIINIVDPLAARETFYAYMPNPLTTPNSSPVFNNTPPVYVCAGEELDLDFAATDVDGDSLVYSFYTPFDGFNGTGITYDAGAAPDNIDISPVTWQPGFGATDPLDATAGLLPGLTISDVGLIGGVPVGAGQFVVGIMIDEYRDGELIGRITRDFQLNVLNCPPPLEAAFEIETNCDGLNVDFTNNSTGIYTTSWWDFGSGDPADSSLLENPSFTYDAPGTYTVTLIIEKGTDCADTATLEITIDNEIDFTVTPTMTLCNGSADGSATVDPSDGTYAYEWSTGDTDMEIEGLTAGTYWVEATNALGCIDTAYFTVDEPGVLDATFTITNPSCFEGLDGSVTVNPVGGTAPYTYSWVFPSSTDPTISDLGAGTYTVTVTDANGCAITLDVTLIQPSELFLTLSLVTNVSCNGDADGSATVAPVGGAGGYTIEWLGIGETGFSAEGLVAGSYIVEVTDANGCQAFLVVEITEPEPLLVDLIILAEETCSDGNGSAYANVSGGVGLLTYVWDPESGDTEVATDLSSGTVGVLVTDENGCQAEGSVFIPDNVTGTASIGTQTPVSCAGGNDGSAEVVMTGGTGPFTYEWSCGCPDTSYVDELSAGPYTVTVTDANGCVETIELFIEELPELIVEVVSTQDALCYGAENGSAEVVASGGTGPYSYSWDTDPVQLTALATGLGAGGYLVTAVDANGCEAIQNVGINQPPELTLEIEVLSNVLCFGDSAGVAAATPDGGTPGYDILWLELGETTNTVTGLVAGTYNVQLTDANGCVTTNFIQIVEYDEVVAEIVFDSIVCPGETVEFMVLTNDINNLYDYNWYVDGAFALEGNLFTYLVTDTTEIWIDLVSAYGCPPLYDSVLVEPIMIDPANLVLTGTEDTICLGADAMVQAEVDDMTYITDLWWNYSELEGFGPHYVTPEGSTNYAVTIRNVCNEEYALTIPIDVYMPPSMMLSGAGTVGCDDVNVAFQFEMGDYEWPISDYSWLINGEEYEDLNPIVLFEGGTNANATLNLTFENGCTFAFEDAIGLTIYESPDADFYYNPDPAKQSEITEFIDISHGNPEYWQWYLEGAYFSDEERPTWVFEETGEYVVEQVVIDYNGCSDTAVHTVTVIGDFLVYVPNAFTPDGNGVNNNWRPVMTNISGEDFELFVFNRWGEVVWQTNDIYASWDGSYQGGFVQDDVYVWRIVARDHRSELHEFNGHVTILR